MRRRFAAMAVLALLVAAPAGADDKALLIQTLPGGSYKVWHSEGATRLADEELIALSASARPEGGEPVPIAVGMAKAFDTPLGIMIYAPSAPTDRMLLIDRDECGGVRVWHSDGSTNLTETQLTDIVLRALPGGGERVDLGDRVAKGYVTPLGVVAVLWRPLARPPAR